MSQVAEETKVPSPKRGREEEVVVPAAVELVEQPKTAEPESDIVVEIAAPAAETPAEAKEEQASPPKKVKEDVEAVPAVPEVPAVAVAE
jgi:hypothetical protein